MEELDRAQLLSTVRTLLAEANALSSRIAAVNEIGIAVNQSLDLSEILQVIAVKAKWLMDFEHLSVCLRNDDAWCIVTLFGEQVAYDHAMLTETESIGYVLRTGQSRVVRDEPDSPFLNGFASQIIIALSIEGIVIGTINFASRASGVYTQEDLRIAYMFALQLAAAIRNANHVQELQAAHQVLRRYAAELEERNQELDAFGHTIAHDLKTPLSGILLKSDMLRRRYADVLPDRAVEQLDGIAGNVKQMSTMIDQLLWLARLRDASFNLIPLDVASIAEAAVARFREAIDSQRIAVEIAPDLPPVVGHAQWIEEVFANLISNAIKYMGRDNPCPRIAIRGLPDGACVRYEVQDTGIGIAQADQARLFEMFSRLNVVNAEGLGLGLSIVHRIVTKLQGQVGVDSAPGQGSTFWFSLPADLPSAQA